MTKCHLNWSPCNQRLVNCLLSSLIWSLHIRVQLHFTKLDVQFPDGGWVDSWGLIILCYIIMRLEVILLPKSSTFTGIDDLACTYLHAFKRIQTILYLLPWVCSNHILMLSLPHNLTRPCLHKSPLPVSLPIFPAPLGPRRILIPLYSDKKTPRMGAPY